MELAVGIFIRLLHSADGFNDVESGDDVNINTAGVTHKAEYCLGLTDAGVNIDTLVAEPRHKAVKLSLILCRKSLKSGLCSFYPFSVCFRYVRTVGKAFDHCLDFIYRYCRFFLFKLII